MLHLKMQHIGAYLACREMLCQVCNVCCKCLLCALVGIIPAKIYADRVCAVCKGKLFQTLFYLRNESRYCRTEQNITLLKTMHLRPLTGGVRDKHKHVMQ